MNIEASGGRAVVCLSRSELERYGVDCAGMSLSDDRTRVLLGDMLKVLMHMGAIPAPGGRTRVSIHCACGSAGGCMLFFTAADLAVDRAGDLAGDLACDRVNDHAGDRANEYVRFSGDDQLLRAALAGAFTDDMRPVPDGGGYILELPAGIEWWRECLLREFAEDGFAGDGYAGDGDAEDGGEGRIL